MNDDEPVEVPVARRRPTDVTLRGGPARVIEAVAYVLRDPVIVVLVLAGFFDGISGNPVHWIVLYGAAFALGRDALRRRAEGSPGETRSASMIDGKSLEDNPGETAWRLFFAPLGVAAILVYAVIVGGFARYSWPATIVVVATGVIVLVASWDGPIRHRPEPGPVGTVGAVAWLTAFIGLGLWELTQLLLQPNLTTDSYAHPTLSTLSMSPLASHPGRTIGLILWLLFGWFLARA